MIRGVLFDFSGTLFRLEPDPAWSDELISVLTASTLAADHLPAALADDWARRDLDPDLHRSVYLASLAASDLGLSAAEAEATYERMLEPESWRPYPDTGPALERLRDKKVAVVSNIPWDIRRVFRRYDLDGPVDEFVLSYAEGVMKPDPKIFLVACQRLGVAPDEALMVGDSREADGGAAQVGIRTAIIDHLPSDQRPDALLSTLDEYGLTG
ncbi:MAG TPA: HAD family hydrolase [Actinophytocola sp.]|jgi:HAD superfamily hydrolase (TIGR01509 family)|uniref:HAD family hydrolase n=1 Tax=Actinophytocola sp. TaxID=1872138 RepID=UPI002F9480F4